MHLPEPGFVQGVVLGARQKPILIRVPFSDDMIHGKLGAIPDAFQEAIVRAHLALAQDAKNRAALTVDGISEGVDGMAEVDRTVAQPESSAILHLVAAFTLDNGKDPRQPLGILPDVRAVSRTAVHPFVQVVHAILQGQPLGHLGLHAIQRDKRSLQEPVRQRGIVPGVGPGPSCLMQFLLPNGHGARGIGRGWPQGGIEVDVMGSRSASETRDVICVGKTPG